MHGYINMVLILLAFGVDQGLLLCHGLIANGHGYEIRVLYLILDGRVIGKGLFRS